MYIYIYIYVYNRDYVLLSDALFIRLVSSITCCPNKDVSRVI